MRKELSKMAQSMAQALLKAGLVNEKQVDAVEREEHRRKPKRQKSKKRCRVEVALDQKKRLEAIHYLKGLTGFQVMDLGAAKAMVQIYGVFPFCYECKRQRRDTKFWSSEDQVISGCFCEECRKKLGLEIMWMDCSLDTFRKRSGLEPLPEGTDFPDLQAQLDEMVGKGEIKKVTEEVRGACDLCNWEGSTLYHPEDNYGRAASVLLQEHSAEHPDCKGKPTID